MTLTYSTIFLVSLLAALLILYIYKKISDVSRSIYQSKKRIRRSNAIMGFQNEKAAHTRAASAIPSGNNSRTATRNLTEIHPSVPQAQGERGTSWPYRKNKSVTIGSAYKVKRKTAGKKQGDNSEGKPWGW